MHQAAKAALIFPEGDGARELRLIVAAVPAAAIPHQQLRTEEKIAANHALGFADRHDGGKTFRTDGNPGNVIERSLAESAIGREKNGERVTEKTL
jgi:hypothetical protein